MKRDEEDVVVTPIEPETPSADYFFVEEYRKNVQGRFTWAACYEAGQQRGLFVKYRSALSLKSTYHNNRL